VVPGRLDLRLGTSVFVGTASHVAECPDLGPECAGPVAPTPYNHHVALVLVENSLDVGYGLLPWLGVDLRLPFRVADVNPTYSELDGRDKSVPNDIHHHDETLTGLSDPWLSVRVGGRRGALVATGRLGLTLPLGRTEPNPYALGQEGKWHEHLQFGTGTVVPLVGLAVSYDAGPVLLGASAMGLFSFYENDHSFRAPPRQFGGVRVTVPLWDGALSPYGSLDLTHEGEELWAGSPGLEGSNVRSELLVGLGADYHFAGDWTLGVGLRSRVASFTDAAAFDSPGMAQLSLGTSLDLGDAKEAAPKKKPKKKRELRPGPAG
jgi:hypothetical protein